MCPVGNERSGKATTAVSLKEYLQRADQYLQGSQFGGSLYAPRDTHVLTTLQYCLLPVVAGHETSFDLRLYNHQSSARNPSVLAIVICESGTSAFLVRGSENGQRLCFNNGGSMSSFVARRLSDDREQRSVVDNGAPMTAAEKQVLGGALFFFCLLVLLA